MVRIGFYGSCSILIFYFYFEDPKNIQQNKSKERKTYRARYPRDRDNSNKQEKCQKQTRKDN